MSAQLQVDDDSARHGAIHLLRDGQYRRMLSSDVISSTGDVLYWIALVVFLNRNTNAERLIAAAVVVRLSPRVLLGAIAGVVADRFDRRRLMIVLDVSRGLIMLSLAGIVAGDGSPVFALSLVFIACAVSTPYRPCQQSGYPLVVSERDLACANALTSTLAQVTSLIGPLIGAVCLALGEPEWSFVVNAASYFVSAALISRVSRLGGRRVRRNSRSDGLYDELAKGLAAVHSQVGVRSIVGLVVAVMVLRGAELVLHVSVATTLLDIGPAGYGVLCAAIGGGALLAGPFTSRLAAVDNPGLWLLASAVAGSLTLVLLSVTDTAWVAFAVLAFEGVSMVTFEVLAITLLQRVCRREVLGRVLGVQSMLSGTGKLTGSILAPVLISAIGLRGALIGTGLVSAGLVVAFGTQARTSLTEAAMRRSLTKPFTDVLTRLGLFEGASLTALESMAMDTTVEQVDPGDVLVEEGAAPDDLFVIRSGVFVVDQCGMWIRQRGPDEWIGHLGLLRRTPRNATVIAATAGEVWRIPGDSFLRAVTGTATFETTRTDVLATPTMRQRQT